jgi:hypothetical protein
MFSARLVFLTALFPVLCVQARTSPKNDTTIQMGVGDTSFILLPLKVRGEVCKTFTSDLSDASVIEPSSVPVKSNSTDVIITPHALAAGPCSLNLSLQYGKPAVAIVHYVYNFEVSNKRSVLRNAKRERSSEVLPVVMEGDVTPL